MAKASELAGQSVKSRAASDAPAPVDTQIVRELATIITDTGLTEIEVERGDLRVRVARAPEPSIVTAPASAAPPPATAASAASAAPAVETPARADAADAKAHPGAVTSPMVGTAYLSPEPGKAAFVKPGDTVSAGATLLLIEAMKTFNPIQAPKAGKVLEILVSDSQPVEYGEALVILG